MGAPRNPQPLVVRLAVSPLGKPPESVRLSFSKPPSRVTTTFYSCHIHIAQLLVILLIWEDSWKGQELGGNTDNRLVILTRNLS